MSANIEAEQDRILLQVPEAFHAVLKEWALRERAYGHRAVLDKLEDLVGDILPAIEAYRVDVGLAKSRTL